MIGPDDPKLPELSGPTKLGDKNIGDLVENVSFTKEGDTIKASGKLKTITQPWTEFDSNGDNTGHFLPISLPEKCNGQKVKCKGRTDGDREVTIDADLMLIVRLENLSGTLIELEMGGETLARIDITGLIPQGADAIDAAKTDFGTYGKKDEYVSDLKLTWTGSKAKAAGKLLYYKASDHEANTNATTDGNFFPLALSSWFDGVDKTYGITENKTSKDKDIIFTVKSLETPIKVTYNGLTVIEIDMSGMQLMPSTVRTKTRVTPKKKEVSE